MASSTEVKLPQISGRGSRGEPKADDLFLPLSPGTKKGGEFTEKEVLWEDLSSPHDALQTTDKKTANQIKTKKSKNSNPFKVNDDEGSDSKGKEKAALKVYEKTTASFRHGSTRLKFADVDGEEEVPPEKDNDMLMLQRSRRYRKEKENLNDFIVKKREMFLLEYSLSVKREEIKKLDETARSREEALRKSEKLLEEDASRFDAFLKDNNIKTMEATRRADAETKVKLEKIQEIKRLTNETATIKNEIAKYDEQLEECKKYKDFLDKLTPNEWLQEAEQKVDYNVIQILRIEPSKQDEEFQMYFKDPQQLLDIFKQLEENNMALIQNSQQTERVLEEYRSKRKETEEKMEDEIRVLKSQIEALRFDIQKEEDKVKTIEEKSKKGGDSNSEEADENIKLEDLNVKVEEIYNKCIGSNEANLSSLQMLTKIERKMEEIFDEIDKLPKEYVQSMEKQKEKEHRNKLRAEKLEIAKQSQELRIKRALERSQAKPVKRVGKPQMVRTFLKVKKKAEVQPEAEQTAEEQEDVSYFFD